MLPARHPRRALSDLLIALLGIAATAALPILLVVVGILLAALFAAVTP